MKRNILIAIFLIASLQCASNEESVKMDHSNLLIYAENGTLHPVKTVRDWLKRREQILEGMQAAMGELPRVTDLPEMKPKIVERTEFEKFIRQKISLQIEPGHTLFAYLFVPKNLPEGSRVPAVLALHPTHPMGKGDPAGLSGRENRSYGLELAERGFVVLAPDYPSFGDDSTYDFSSDRYVSGTMKGIFNHIRCVDFLCALDFVDPNRLGVIGHSLGGHNAMFVAVFDARLKVIVSSCGWTPFHDYYGGKIKGWTSDRYMPRLKTVYKLNPDWVPFDFYEIVAALAPRAFFSNSPLRDANFDVNGVRKGIQEAKKIYRLYDAEDQLQVRYPDYEHDFPPEIREAAYRFMESVLKQNY